MPWQEATTKVNRISPTKKKRSHLHANEHKFRCSCYAFLSYYTFTFFQIFILTFNRNLIVVNNNFLFHVINIIILLLLRPFSSFLSLYFSFSGNFVHVLSAPSVLYPPHFFFIIFLFPINVACRALFCC